jgi:predicted esterase
MSDFIHQWVEGQPARPTVLALHGTGGTERDLLSLAAGLFPGSAILSPRGNVSEQGANRFFRRLAEGVFDIENLHAETDKLADFVAQSSQKYGFDASRVVALGYSNGANIAASLLLSRPETLAGGILLRAMTPFEPEAPVNLAGKSVFIAAGRFDPIVPVDNVENLAKLLENAGADVTLRWEQASHGLNSPEIEAARQFAAQKFA